MDLVTITFLMLAGHSVCDFALQTEWVATNKNRHVRDRFTNTQQLKLQLIWPWLLSAHSLTHGLAIYLITQKISLALAETVVHWWIDFGKNEAWFGFHTDQALHVAFKLLWAYLFFNYSAML